MKKRSSACHRSMALPSLFWMRMPHTCMPRVCPLWVQNLAKKANTPISSRLARIGSRSSAPASASALSCSAPWIRRSRPCW
ncbi:hypothetical protein D3C84_1151920 [compost metagenome]